jgi:hypothetical protein
MEKMRKVLNILICHLWVVELTYRYFFLQVRFRGASSLILFLLFATSINDTSSTGAKFTTSVVDTGGKFATGLP